MATCKESDGYWVKATVDCTPQPHPRVKVSYNKYTKATTYSFKCYDAFTFFSGPEFADESRAIVWVEDDFDEYVMRVSHEITWKKGIEGYTIGPFVFFKWEEWFKFWNYVKLEVGIPPPKYVKEACMEYLGKLYFYFDKKIASLESEKHALFKRFDEEKEDWQRESDALSNVY